MKSNKSKARFGGAAVIYLMILLMVVILYLGIAYPKLATEINTLNTSINKLNFEINLLAPYASQLAILNEKAEKAEEEFENNKDLDLPVMFSNIIYDSADTAGIKVINLNIAFNSAIETQANYESNVYTASISITADNNAQLERFVAILEQNEGSAMSMQSISYSQGIGALAAEVTILMYSVSK